jgi:hypothetical protein
MNDQSRAQQAMRKARAEAGLDDFGPYPFITPLNELLLDIDNTDIPEAGREILRQNVHRFLLNRLRFADDVKRHPEILHEQLDDPIVVLGFPRSGTTVLQRLMSADPAMQRLDFWRAYNPAPFPNETPGNPAERIAVVQALEDAIRAHNPALFSVHQFKALEAEEDWLLHQMSFQHPCNFVMGLVSQTYVNYTRSLPREPSYAFVADLLRYMQWQDGGRRGRRWILKAPGHIGCIDALLAAHPNATFVYPRRDFKTIVSSFCYSFETFNGDAMRVPPETMGSVAMNFWSHEMERFFETRRRLGKRLKLIEIDYQALMREPIALIREVYQLAGLTLSAEGEAAMRTWLAENPAGKHGSNQYGLERYGLTEAQVESAFAKYASALPA